jgi:hypothetical protein
VRAGQRCQRGEPFECSLLHRGASVADQTPDKSDGFCIAVICPSPEDVFTPKGFMANRSAPLTTSGAPDRHDTVTGLSYETQTIDLVAEKLTDLRLCIVHGVTELVGSSAWPNSHQPARTAGPYAVRFNTFLDVTGGEKCRACDTLIHHIHAARCGLPANTATLMARSM